MIKSLSVILSFYKSSLLLYSVWVVENHSSKNSFIALDCKSKVEMDTFVL